MALFPSSALERAMQIKEVLMRAMNKEYSWLQAADILGITPRGLRRLRKRMEEFGYQGLVDMRRGRPSPRRTPVAEVERILEFYRERYSGFNAKHFFDMVRLRHGVTLSYGCVKQILQGAGLVKRYRSRGRHRRRRERKASFGEMLHIDGSPHEYRSVAVQRSGGLGVRDTEGWWRGRQAAPDRSGRGSQAPGHRAHSVLLTASSRQKRTTEQDASGPSCGRAESSRHHDDRGSQPVHQ